ncbi:CLUMA_CG007749, isoform A [Clunio marinus]|uniref:Lysosomal dipeptide transporter MFSD1 n=1 Tax=Clunio marinus TaxID=568069 RepID=A0A1J1I378_9DIPT|nr:CLUMA_CG007749, isoform A [Clunio marinus]
MPRNRSTDDSRQPILQDNDENERSYNDNELEDTSGCCNPSKTWYRFIALIFMCLVGFASYFCYDNPGALQDNFKADLNLSTTQFAMLYSIYSWPNVILCFIGGFLIDRVFGIRLGTIIYMFILMIGQLIFAFGATINGFYIMLLGRFIFGIGAESLAVAQNNYAVSWFKGKELNMVFGLQLSFARVGSTVNFLVMESVYKYVKQYYSGPYIIGMSLFIAAGTCIMSFISALVLGWMDKRAETYLRRVENTEGETPHLSDVKTFKVSFWMVSVICVAYYVAIFPFIALGKVFFERKYDYTPEQANTVNSVIYSIAAIASPLCGYIVDRTGRNVMWVFMSTVITIGAHALLAFSFVNPYIGTILMGIAYSMLASSLWPLVALIIPEYQLGTAYGICQSVQNLGLAVVSMFAGVIVDKGGYLMLELFFIGWLSVALLATVIIWLQDFNNNGTLNMTPSEREEQAKTTLPQLTSSSINDEGSDEPDRQAREVRNKYLNRIGVGDTGNSSDTEPLLQ